MNSNILKSEDITENIIALNVNRSYKEYKENMTEIKLYEITRGYWRIDIKRAQYVDYAMSVYKDTIIEVYRIEQWLPAGTTPRITLPDAEVPEGRYEFKGKIAEKEIRDKYRGKSIENLSKLQNPIKYFNCVPDKNKFINKEELCNNATIEKVQKIEEEISSLNVEGASKKAIVNARVNQGIFRDFLLKKYNRCRLCKVETPALLIASHIKPWAESEPKEKLDVDNGFLMCPNHDKLLDKGYITFDDDGKIIISDRLTKNDRECLGVNDKMHIDLTKRNKKYLKFHREKVFDREMKKLI